MWYKPYGRTGKEVSVIGFGAMRFPHPQDIDASAAIVHHAHGKGINYFDTAPYYCNDKSEEIMGHALAALPRESFYVSTKCSAAKGAEIRASLERSLKRLRVESIDFFHIWCLLKPEQLSQRIEGGAIAAVLKAKEEGLVKHIVVSAHLSGREIADVLDQNIFEGITLGYNALNFPFRQEGLDAALKHNLGVATMNPLGGGVIPRQAERLKFLQGPADRSVVEAALRFNISQPAVTLALVGFGSTDEVDQAVAATENFSPYPADHIARLKDQIAASFNGFCTGCGYCLPCPAELPIPKLMDAYNQKIFEGSDNAIRNRLKWHWNIAPDVAAACLHCSACEAACTQHLDIQDRLKTIAALVEPPQG